jgi:hypothetical protein
LIFSVAKWVCAIRYKDVPVGLFWGALDERGFKAGSHAGRTPQLIKKKYTKYYRCFGCIFFQLASPGGARAIR